MPKENRTFEVEDIEIRAADDGTENRFVEGIGVVYDREVEIWPGFMERVRPGAFAKTLDSRDEIKSFFNHDPSQVLATTRSKPALILEDSEKSLRFKAPIPPTSYGNDLRVNLERKNVRGASFSFSIAEDGDIITRDEKGIIHREITKATIYEVGPVTNPAYSQTSAHLRSAEDAYRGALAIIEREERAAAEAAAQAALNVRKNEVGLLEKRI